MREAEASLRRLNTDDIDLYQLHWPDNDTHAPIEETMRAFDDLVTQGKVRYVGVCNVDVPLLAQAMRGGRLTALQPPFSLLRRDAEAELLPFCHDHGIGVVAYSPLASGLLGGRYTADQAFAPGDWCSRNPNIRGEGLRKNLAIVERLRAIAARFGRMVPELAVAWVLSNPAITAAIVGVRKPDHITGVVPAADWRLDEATLAEIDQAVGRP